MKHVKLILIIVALAFIAGFVTWQLMWMKEVGGKYKAEKSLYETPRKEEPQERNEIDDNRKRERALSMIEEEPLPVQESRPLTEQPVSTQQTKEKPEKIKVDRGVQSPVKETKPVLQREPEERSGYAEDEDAYEERNNAEIKPDPDAAPKIIMKNKTMSVTIKGKTESSTPANRAPRQPVKTQAVKIQSAAQHPTSSMP